ncbi:unnamed protein product [Mycena citricolor]|uniref:CBF1-interacting co-repressor CIR N-terminal domain-containing protein n=1 Tax=Mycena citricolor TaxID=2018698 RepID=A0AAD2HEK9_9AGAR|nr:unnamed protein product [Mycena citricolor]
MGKLNIAHHKSYHPYRRDNIEKVRRDEEEARQQEAKEEGRMLLADSEARIELLRERSGGKKMSKRREEEKILEQATSHGSLKPAVLPTSGGHINFFEDLEHARPAPNAIAASVRTATKKTDPVETERGFPLAPSAKDLKPWYTTKVVESNDQEEVVDEKRKRDTARKSIHDPLTSITHQLASRHGSNTASVSSSYRTRPVARASSSSTPPEVQARLSRESSERERAQALIRRKQQEMRGSQTPSTVHGGYDGGYSDVFNRREVDEAHRRRDTDHRRTLW